MKIVQYTAPTIEPITRAELLTHLRLDSGTWDGNLTLTQSLAYGSKAVQDNYTVHVGTGIDVLGKQADVIVHHGTNGATGTVDTKIQEADALAGPYTDWTGGAFTQVTTANDNADYKKAYTGTKQYIRTASKVLLAACDFGTSVLVNAAVTAEDDDLADLITDGRTAVENITRRALLTQTWDYYLDAFPDVDFIKLPFGNLQSTGLVITYKKSDWLTVADTVTMTLTTDYLIETNGEGIGRIVLPYGESWPSATLFPSQAIKIEFACGWTTAALVPKNIKRAVKFAAEDAYYHGNRHEVLQPVIMNLLASARLWDEF
jgi:uncharacterized phiE125 gp8 family phage protein